MVNAMELLQNYRQAESQIAARNQAMQLQAQEEQRNAMMMPLKMQAMQASIQNPRNALAFQMRQADEANALRREAIQSRERTMANSLAARGNRPGQIIQTEDGIYERGSDGSIKPLTGPNGQILKPKGSEKPMTEFQGKSSSYGTRAQNSHDILNDLEGKYEPWVLANKEALARTPVIGGLANATANLMVSDNTQRAEQAQRDFVNATLRQESGATINPEEFDNAKKQYFPQPGDSAAVIAQKKRNREIAIAGFERAAGKEGGASIRQIREENANRRAPQAGMVKDGYRFKGGNPADPKSWEKL